MLFNSADQSGVPFPLLAWVIRVRVLPPHEFIRFFLVVFEGFLPVVHCGFPFSRNLLTALPALPLGPPSEILAFFHSRHDPDSFLRSPFTSRVSYS